MIGKEIVFKSWKCVMTSDRYANGNKTIYLGLIDKETREPVAHCTVNTPETPVSFPHVLIKEYSENEGMTKALIDAGIVELVNEVKIGNFSSTANLCILTSIGQLMVLESFHKAN